MKASSFLFLLIDDVDHSIGKGTYKQFRGIVTY